MSNAAGIRAGKAYVELFADDSRLTSGLKRAQERLKAFGNALRQSGASMALVGGAMLAPLIHAVKTFMESAKDGKLAGAELGKAITLHQTVRATSASIKQLENAVGAALTPTLVTLADQLQQILGSFTAWAKENPGTVTAIALVAGGVAGLGALLFGLGAAINVAAWSFGGLAMASSAAFGVISTAAAAVLSPIGLVAAAIGGLGYVIATQTDSGRESLNYLGQGFDRLADDAKAAWGGIGDALASGDIGLAAQIGLAAVKLEFQRAWSFIIELSAGFLVGMNKMFLAMGEKIAGIIVSVAALHDALMETLDTAAELRQVKQDTSIARSIAGTGEWLGLLPEGTSDQTRKAADALVQNATKKAGFADAGTQSQLALSLASVTEQADEMRQSLNEGLSNFVDANDANIAALRAQLDALRTSASDGRKKLEDQMKAKGDAATAAAAAVTARAPKADVFGAFSTAASFGMGIGSTAADRTAKATEEGAKELKLIREKIYTGETPTFAP